MVRGNQFKPVPPLTDELKAAILQYWNMRLTDKEILARLLAKHIDTTQHGLSLSTFKKWRLNELNLSRTRKQAHTAETIHESMKHLRERFPKAGEKEVRSLLFHEKEMQVSRSVIRTYFQEYEPELIRARKANRLKRKRFWAAGVNDIWAVDQHDKWKYKFGLAFHTSVEPVSGRLMWMRVWWTNSNPRLILSYYLDTVEETGVMPMVTQSDPGTENYGIANGHTYLRQWHDPSLEGTLQHRWMRQKKNIIPEITWSQLRRRWSPGFENILDEGISQDLYDSDNPIQSMIFRWVFIPWIQKELDKWVARLNNDKKRADKNKVLPHGPPNDIFGSPERYDVLDFGIKVKPEAINDVRQLYAPPDHEVFILVPADFAQIIGEIYIKLGCQPVDISSVWEVYENLHDHLLATINGIPAEISNGWAKVIEASEVCDITDVAMFKAKSDQLQPLLGGVEERDEDGNFYLGGINQGQGEHYDLSNEEQVIFNASVELLDVDAEEQPEAYLFSSDEDEAFINTYLLAPSPTKPAH